VRTPKAGRVDQEHRAVALASVFATLVAEEHTRPIIVPEATGLVPI
jgi:hypothetical protein